MRMIFQSALKYAFAVLAFTSTTRAHPQQSSNSEISTLARRATVCNGHAELCDRSFGNVTYIGTHNSYAIGVNNLGANQDQPVLQQLNDGIRMLQMQAHNASGVIKLCHSDCSLVYDGGTLENYLKIVKGWLDANPNEVLSLLIVNINNLPATRYDTVFKAVGLDTMSYAPTTTPLPATGWPTLGSLIDSGKRLLTFIDNTANSTAVPYIIDEFSNIWETSYDVTDPAFDCKVNRTRGDNATQMYLINHFLDEKALGVLVPAVSQLNQTNAATGTGSVGAQVSTCVEDHGRPPNFILVDYYEYAGGAVFQVAASINGVPYSPSSPVATPSPTTSTTGPKTTSSPLSGSATTDLTASSSFIITLLTLFIAQIILL